MGPLFDDPLILAGVVGGLGFLVALKVTAFLVVRRVMRRPPVPADQASSQPGERR